MGDARGKLAERGAFLRLEQSILRAAQIVDGLGELLGARLDLVEKPSVFDRDHSLVGESLQRLDLALRIEPRLAARKHDRAFDTLLAKKRHAEQCPRGIAERRNWNGVVFVLENIRDLFDLPGENRASGHSGSISRRRMVYEIAVDLILSVMRTAPLVTGELAVAYADRAGIGVVEINGGRNQRIEYSLQIERRTADD